MKINEAIEILNEVKKRPLRTGLPKGDPMVNKKIEKTLRQMEKHLMTVGREQDRGDFEGETFFEGYLSATEVWLNLLAKEFPGLRNKVK